MHTPQQIADELARTIPVLQEEADKAMHRMLEVTRERWAEHAPHGATGRLADDTSMIVRSNATGVSGVLQPKTPELRQLAGYLDKGTGLWVEHHSAITPKAARGPRAALRFADGSFRRSSKGTKPTRFVEKTKESSAVEVQEIGAAGAVKATERLFR